MRRTAVVNPDTQRFGMPPVELESKMASRLPLLVTGIAGVPGFNALHYFQARYPRQVLGIRRADQWPLSGNGIIGCDLEDRAGLEQLFTEHGFRAVLSCAGSCKLKNCELDPGLADRVNVQSVRNILQVLKGSDVRLVHTSIDLVFAGRDEGGYCEDETPDPVTVYGKTMVEAEELILNERPDSLILRISLPMGISFNGHAGAIDWIQSRFKQHKPATLYYDEVRAPTYTDCLNRLYERALLEPLSGVYHAAGERRLSLFEIAQIVNKVGGYDPSLLQGCLRHEAGPMPPRAGNVTLDSSRLTEALGGNPFDPWPWHDELTPIDRQWHFARELNHDGGLSQIEGLLYQNPEDRERAHS